MPNQSWVPLGIFSAMLLSSALFALAASGHFPRQHRAAAFDAPLGRVILFGGIVVVALSIAAALDLTVRRVPWYALVIGAGLAVLSAPLVLRPFPDRFVDGRSALLTFAAITGLLTLTLALMR
jgi:hypothetical protein